MKFKVGDKVIAENKRSGERYEGIITNQYKAISKNIYELKLKDDKYLMAEERYLKEA